MSVLIYNPEALSEEQSVWHCFLAYQPQKLPESWRKVPIKKKKKQQNPKCFSVSDLSILLFYSSNMLNNRDNRQFLLMGNIVWVLIIWSNRRIDLFPCKLEYFSPVKNNDSINQKMFSYLPVPHLVHLEGKEIYLGISQHTEGKISFGK